MPMRYDFVAIPDDEIPLGAAPELQHLVETYASETNKVASVWLQFDDADLSFRPHPKSTNVGDILKHQILSERRFFAEFVGLDELAPTELLPAESSPRAMAARFVELARRRLGLLAERDAAWWYERVRFFDVDRERIWIFWRRVLHTAHHRTQLTVYLRLLDKPVPATYGPTADVTWEGATPTLTVEAAGLGATPPNPD